MALFSIGTFTTQPGQVLGAPTGGPTPLVGVGIIFNPPNPLSVELRGFIFLGGTYQVSGSAVGLQFDLGRVYLNASWIPLVRARSADILTFVHSRRCPRPLTFTLIVEV